MRQSFICMYTKAKEIDDASDQNLASRSQSLFHAQLKWLWDFNRSLKLNYCIFLLGNYVFVAFPGYLPVMGQEGLWFVWIWREHPQTQSNLVLEKPGIEPATPGLQGIALIHYTTGASLVTHFSILLINAKMATNVGFLAFMGRINFMRLEFSMKEVLVKMIFYFENIKHELRHMTGSDNKYCCW